MENAIAATPLQNNRFGHWNMLTMSIAEAMANLELAHNLLENSTTPETIETAKNFIFAARVQVGANIDAYKWHIANELSNGTVDVEKFRDYFFYSLLTESQIKEHLEKGAIDPTKKSEYAHMVISLGL